MKYPSCAQYLFAVYCLSVYYSFFFLHSSAPGSGPMFKSTTVAVESFNKSCFMDKEENQTIAEQETESQIPWPYRGKTKKQTLRRKIAFSFSFPKKASLKLESSAAVFCESTEDKKLIKYDTDMMTHQKSSTKSSLNDAVPASDLCAFLVYSEDRSVSPISHFPTVSGSSDLSLYSEESNIVENKEDSSQEESTINDAPQPTSCDVSSFQSQEKDVFLRKPSQPFISVVGRDGKTIFQWPSEMVCFTKTEPSMSFSCNPLHFDFRGSQFRKSPDDFQNKNDQELSFISEKSPKTSFSSYEISTEEATCRMERNILYSSNARSKCKHLKNWPQSSKRAEDKLQGRDRRHYRSQHKKRHKRRSRWQNEDHREMEQSAKMKKWTKLHKREGFESRFRGCAAQQEQQLEKSKQSAQNQAENNSTVSSAGESVEVEKVLDISQGTLDVPALGQTTITRNDSHHLSVIPSDHETSVTDHSSLTIPKKRQSDSQSKEDNVWSDHTQCGVIEELDKEEDVLCLNQGPKRQKLDQSPTTHLTDEHPAFVVKGPDGIVDMESTWNILNLKDPGTCDPEGDNVAGEASTDKNCISTSDINSQGLPEQDLQPKEANQLPTVQNGDSATEKDSENECNKCAITSRVKEKEKVSHDKSCQHTPPLPGFQLLDEERQNCAIQSPFNPMLCFTSQLSGVERHGFLHSHTHKQVLHQKVFSAKLRSTLPLSSPIIHPVHLPSAIPSSSITVLQHHSTFLPTQPSLFTQVVPLTRLPLAPEITPFITSSQVSMVAPPTIHTTAVTFHTLPRPQVFRPLLHPPTPFPPLLPPHTTVIPLQPLF